jgi:uncharacterized protein involved in exopolysaccharide biosynthesis
MNELINVGVLLVAIVGALLALAPRVSESLVRWRARRLPRMLAPRMQEEWLAELGALPGRPSQLAFAIALTLTRRHSFAIEEDGLLAAPSRSPITAATFGGWPSVMVLTTVVAAAIAYAASFLIQPLYRSTTHIQVVPQRVAARFVEPVVRLTLDERLRGFSQVALSRQRLEEIILQFDLYRSDRGAATERMRKNIIVEPHADGQSFEIGYVSTDPQLAMTVTAALAALFFETSLRDREDMTSAASQLLDAQIDDVRSRLLKRTGIIAPPPANRSEADVRALEQEMLKATFRGLLLKKEQVMMSGALERRQIGETFRLLDPARLPDAPISPDRTRVTLLGAVVGFCLGVAMMLTARHAPVRRTKTAVAQ